MLLRRNCSRNGRIFGWSLRHYGAKAQAAVSESEWESVVGLEVHAQINSKSKLFSGASCDGLHKLANSCVSHFDASVPGTLPRLNKRCVEAGVKTALALNCDINTISMFDRKHYFYADSPAGYQVTQQRLPLASNGSLTFPVMISGKETYYKTVRLHQLQLEQDSGKSLHFPELKRSLIDLNRAGAPLMELVFDPDLRDGEEAAALVKELVLVLQIMGSSTARWHEAAIRVDANISIRRKGDPLGVRTEVKNISSPRAIARAVSYEIERQIMLVEDGGVVTNETRQWDAELKQTIRMRDKEVLQDYRFMPEPNLLPLNLDMVEGLSVDDMRKTLPKLPAVIRQSLCEDYGLHPTTAVMLTQHEVFRPTFFHMIPKLQRGDAKALGAFLVSDIRGALKRLKMDECNLSIEQLEDLFNLQHSRVITKTTAHEILDIILQDPTQMPSNIVEKKDLKQINDVEVIRKVCEDAVSQNARQAKLFRKGRPLMLTRIVQDALNQRANPEIVSNILTELIIKKN